MILSVVVPAYNEERCLSGLLESLRQQDYRGHYEVIVVDNGSTDRTGEVARSFGARVVSCLRKGVVYARHVGLMAAEGELIAQADADEVLPPTWLSRIAEHFAAHPQDVGLTGRARYTGEPLWHRPMAVFSQLVNGLAYRFTGKPFSILAGNFAARRAALIAAGSYNFALPHCGDERALLDRLTKVGHVSYDRELVVESSSRRFRGRFFQAIFVDQLYHTIVPVLLNRFVGVSHDGMRRDLRAERRPTPLWAVSLRLVVFLVPLSIILFGFYVPGSSMFGKVYAQERTRDKVVALTFDDGPNEPYTSEILDILNQYGVKATFFAVGINVKHYPDTARRIVGEGHVLGNHSWDHGRLNAVMHLRYHELRRTQETIEEVTGVSPCLFRPPFGQKTPWQLWQVRREHMVAVAWSVSANDPKRPPSQQIVDRVVRKARPGAIVLLHDGGETVHGADRSGTVAALPLIIERLSDNGYRFVTVPELLKANSHLNCPGG